MLMIGWSKCGGCHPTIFMQISEYDDSTYRQGFPSGLVCNSATCSIRPIELTLMPVIGFIPYILNKSGTIAENCLTCS